MKIKVPCYKCGKTGYDGNWPGAKYCTSCGTHLCSSCGKHISRCPNCKKVFKN